jgi:hypothetical protein
MKYFGGSILFQQESFKRVDDLMKSNMNWKEKRLLVGRCVGEVERSCFCFLCQKNFSIQVHPQRSPFQINFLIIK